MSRLTPEAFCHSVADSLRQRRPGLQVRVAVEDEHFVVRMQLPERPATTWRWPVDEPAYDAELGEPWSRDQADYLALLAEEENTGYLAQAGLATSEGIPFRVRKRRWWRRA